MGRPTRKYRCAYFACVFAKFISYKLFTYNVIYPTLIYFYKSTEDYPMLYTRVYHVSWWNLAYHICCDVNISEIFWIYARISACLLYSIAKHQHITAFFEWFHPAINANVHSFSPKMFGTVKVYYKIKTKLSENKNEYILRDVLYGKSSWHVSEWTDKGKHIVFVVWRILITENVRGLNYSWLREKGMLKSLCFSWPAVASARLDHLSRKS